MRDSLVRKNLPLDAESYENLDHFDADNQPVLFIEEEEPASGAVEEEHSGTEE